MVTCEDAIDCPSAGGADPCDPQSGTDQIELILDFDGCGIVGSAPCGKATEFIVVGKGTITTNGRQSVNCTDYGSTIYATLNGVEDSLEVEDCDTVNVDFVWFGDECCPCCLYGIASVESDYCGGAAIAQCDSCLTYKARSLKNNLKRNVLSRMKKVHYRP